MNSNCHRQQKSVLTLSVNQFILSHTNSINSNLKISNTFMLCVTGSDQGAYTPHEWATRVQ